MTYLFAHGGKGECGIRMVWDQQDFRNNWGFLAHVLLPAGVSIGYHRHDLMEETYVGINGSGRMTVDDETEVVYEGAVIPNRMVVHMGFIIILRTTWRCWLWQYAWSKANLTPLI